MIPANRSPIVPEADGKPSFRRAYIVVFELTLMTEYAGPKALKVTLKKTNPFFIIRCGPTAIPRGACGTGIRSFQRSRKLHQPDGKRADAESERQAPEAAE